MPESNNEYNGYSNRLTYHVCLFLDNDETENIRWGKEARRLLAFYREHPPAFGVSASQQARMDLRQKLRDAFRAPDIRGLFGDILSVALASVDWREVAQSRFEEED